MMSSAHRCPEIKSRDYDANLRDGFLFFSSRPCSLWDFDSPAKGRKPAACSGSLES